MSAEDLRCPGSIAVVTAILSIFANATCAAPTPIEYKSSDGTQRVTFKEIPTIWMTMYSGDTYQVFPVSDCSDVHLICRGAGFLIFAVPRQELYVDSTYAKGGVTFSVAKCLKSAGRRCSLAVIKGRCSPDPLSACSRALAGNESWDQGIWTYFVYDNVRGIRSFGYAYSAEEPQNVDQLARQFSGFKGALSLSSRISSVP